MKTTLRYLLRSRPCGFKAQSLYGRNLIRFHSNYSYFNSNEGRDGQRTKTVSLRDISIPSSEIRQFIKLVHPDRFQVFIYNKDSDMEYTLDQLKSMQDVNENNLSTLNSILEFSRKHSKMITSELLKPDHQNKNKADVIPIPDRKLTQNAPNPTHLEFYIEKRLEKETYFEHIHVKFDCKEMRPFVSQYYKALNNTLNKLFMCCDIDRKSWLSSDTAPTKKFSDLDIDKAMKFANNGDVEAHNFINEVFHKHLSKETQERNRIYGVNTMKYKVENKKIFFAATLDTQQIKAIMDTLYRASGEFAIDLVFDFWMEVPIIICHDEMECLKCPNYVVAIPWYCDVEEFVLYIQDQIVHITKHYKRLKCLP